MELDQIQRKFAVDCFNGTWDLIEKPDRTLAETRQMIAMAYTSFYHWTQVGKPLNFARGHWQIARVWAVAGDGQNALVHAQMCLELCQENGIGDFDLAFAYEALARASAVLGDNAAREQYLAQATAAGERIAKPQDKEHFLSELTTI
ncbi:MAG TPA: hypothetical protein VNT75_16650 [Symbiobacteriaceae bacterium]|nr:hypothetical protein [Symbiobacteriaceae bacterium]